MKTIFINGKIFTAKDTQTFVQSMMVEDGKILWIGMESELPQDTITGDAPDTIRYIDLKGKTVIPGFVDAHMHPAMLAEYSKQIACLPPKVNSIADLVSEIAKVREELLIASPRSIAPKEEIQTKTETQNEAGLQRETGLTSTTDTQTKTDSLTELGALPWIRGWGYDEGKYAEQRSPNRYDLDKGSPDLPVFLVRSCEHIRCVNSKALEIAGITKDTPDPPGGAIDRDEQGEPTGVLRENARDLVLPFMPEDTEEELIDALVDLSHLLTSQGIVGVADMGNLHPGGNYELYEAAAKKGFQQRVALYYMWDYFKDDPTFADYLGALKPGDVCQESVPPKMDYNNRIRITGLKLIGDGSISGRTAWMNQPFLDGESGMPVYSDDDFESALAFAKRTGCQLSVHAMGGRAIDRVVSRMQREEDWISKKPFADYPSLRIEHLTEPSQSAMQIAAKKGFAFITQPIFEYCEIETYKANMDAERLKHIYPSRTMLERGISLAFSTDAPATSWAVPSDPFPNLKSAVTRKAYDGTDIGCGDSARDDSEVGASSRNDSKDKEAPAARSDGDERVDVATAILLYTKKAAAVCGFAGLGQLTPGYCADFAVLSDDIFTVAPDSIDQICVEQTYINGQCVYRR